MTNHRSQPHSLAPLRTRLAVFAALALIALAAIVLVDRRAMIRMHELQAEYTASPETLTP